MTDRKSTREHFADALAYGLAKHRELEQERRADPGPGMFDLLADAVEIKLHDRDPDLVDAKPTEWTPVKDSRVRSSHSRELGPVSFGYTRATFGSTLAEWQQTCARVKTQGPIAITFEALDGHVPGYTYIRGHVTTEDVNRPGYEISLEFQRVAPSYCRDDAARVQYLRELVCWFFVHEANERIEVDGARPFVPHEEHGL